jgi:hypothetical protein
MRTRIGDGKDQKAGRCRGECGTRVFCASLDGWIHLQVLQESTGHDHGSRKGRLRAVPVHVASALCALLLLNAEWRRSKSRRSAVICHLLSK